MEKNSMAAPISAQLRISNGSLIFIEAPMKFIVTSELFIKAKVMERAKTIAPRMNQGCSQKRLRRGAAAV